VPAILFEVADAKYSPLDPANIAPHGPAKNDCLGVWRPGDNPRAPVHSHFYKKLHKLVN
jgi:hypothetical protein